MTLPPALSDPGLARLWAVLPEARVVGGAVRDVLAGRPLADIDLATPRTPEQVTQALAAAGIRAIPTGIEHGTVTALPAEMRPVEVTTLRRDVQTDGRHAVVAFTDDWQQDAARRDFTFNAMSVDRAGTIFDYFGGADDLTAGRVRFVGDPRLRIAEDFLRVLRYFRFFARYGCQDPDPSTREALRDAAAGLVRLSAERVWAELQKILATPDPRRSLSLMRELAVLEQVVPGPLTLDRLAARLAQGLPSDPLLRLAALSEAGPAALLARYRLSSTEVGRLAAMRGDVPPDNADDGQLRRGLFDHGRRAVIDRTWLLGRSDAMRARVAALDDPVFPILGRDLLASGMAPGRDLGLRLADLRAHWRDGGCVASRAELLAELAPPAAG